MQTCSAIFASTVMDVNKVVAGIKEKLSNHSTIELVTLIALFLSAVIFSQYLFASRQMWVFYRNKRFLKLFEKKYEMGMESNSVW